MERKFTLVFSLLLCISFVVMAAAPTVPASNLDYTTVDGGKLTLQFRKGDGQFRIVVMKEGSPVATLPVNGMDYTANPSFGFANTAFNGSDGFVVYRNSSSNTTISVPVTNLSPATIYYISIFEFNGTGTATEYNMVALTGSKATVSAPTTQGSFKLTTNIIGNSVQLNWNAGNGERRLILARKGAPVNAAPADLTSYTGDLDFGDGPVIDGDNYVVYANSSGTSATIKNMEPNTTYHFAMFEYNGSSTPVYMQTAATTSCVTNAGPTKPSGPINFSTVDGDRLQLSFSKGNGKYQLIIAKKGSAVTAQPQNGQLYDASTAFGDGFEIADGEFVVNSLGTDRMVTNLDKSALYFFRIYDFDIDANGNTYYLTSASSSISQSTALPPATPPNTFDLQTVTGTSISFRYTAGDSKYRLIVIKAGSPVDALPTDLERYDGGSANYGQGEQITPGNYVIYGQTNGNGAAISMLTPGITYHIAIWGWNGLNYPVYGQNPLRYEVTIPNEPSTPGTNLTTGSIEGNSFSASWSGGDGARRLVIARKGAAVTALPQDGQTYTADPDFDEGTAIEDGQFVVYEGTARAFTLRKLDIGSTYHLAVFDYNVTNNLPDYRTSTFLAGEGTTASAPTGQAQVNLVDNIQANSARINFAKGNGTGRVIIMRAQDPVSVEPQDLESYSSGNNLGNGNFVVVNSTSSTTATVFSLTPNTEYHVAIFEYNGSSAPVFNRPGATYSFTTAADGGGIVPPTVNSSNPLFDVDGNKLTFNWDEGDGARRIVVMKQGSAITFQPIDGTDYPAIAEFSNGTDLGSGQYVVYNGTGASAIITHLQPATDYTLSVFEYNGTGATSKYLLAGALTVQQSTATSPAAGSTDINATATENSVSLSWQAGSGDGRMVVMKEEGTVQGLPADLSEYPASAAFKGGTQIAAGEYVVYSGTGNSVLVTGLDAHKTYYFSVFEFNGSDAPVYNTLNVLSGQVTPGGPLPLTWVYFTAKEKQGKVELKWGTTDEAHTAHFVIERSEGGFVAVDSVQAQNSPGDHDYTFTDVHASASSLQYRIKQVDIDGKYTYSKIVSVNLSAAHAVIRLYPNPVTESFRVLLPAGVNQAQLMLYDMSGKLVLNRKVNNSELIAIGHFPKGLYHVLVDDGMKKYTEKLVRQ